MYRALEAGLVQMAGVEEGAREELLRRVACAEEGAVVMKVRGWRAMWPARERYLSKHRFPIFISAAPEIRPVCAGFSTEQRISNQSVCQREIEIKPK